jgi:hypothetical protein
MKNTIKLGLCGAAALALASSANATPSVYLSDGTTAQVVTDNGVGDLNSALNTVLVSTTIGQWTVNTETGVVIGPSNKPELDLSFVDLFSGSGASTLTVAFFSDGYNSSLYSGVESIGGTLGAGTSLTYSVFANTGSTGNTTMGTTASPLTALNLAGWTALGAPETFGPGGAFAGSQTGGLIPPVGGNPYELIQVITISVSRDHPSSISSGDAHFSVPDGSSTLMLLGSGLTALAFVRRSVKSKA